MTFGMIKIHTGDVSVDNSTERGIFKIDIEFCDVYSKDQIQRVASTLSKITVDDMLELFNKVNKRG